MIFYYRSSGIIWCCKILNLFNEATSHFKMVQGSYSHPQICLSITLFMGVRKITKILSRYYFSLIWIKKLVKFIFLSIFITSFMNILSMLNTHKRCLSGEQEELSTSTSRQKLRSHTSWRIFIHEVNYEINDLWKFSIFWSLLHNNNFDRNKELSE